ncbi:MAG: hypothetical protein H7144_05865 [Burkholderiales bacterium]|nr:hypothetical protein [Phycisphaerae bacterium]
MIAIACTPVTSAIRLIAEMIEPAPVPLAKVRVSTPVLPLISSVIVVVTAEARN